MKAVEAMHHSTSTCPSSARPYRSSATRWGHRGRLGFVGAPWTPRRTSSRAGAPARTRPSRLHGDGEPRGVARDLSKVADAVGTYVGYQIDAGAQCVQIDSWGGSPAAHVGGGTSPTSCRWLRRFAQLASPDAVRQRQRRLLERMATTGVDCIGPDWTIDMADGRARVGDLAVQGNVDPAVPSPRGGGGEGGRRLRKGGAEHVLNLGTASSSAHGGKRQALLRRKTIEY